MAKQTAISNQDQSYDFRGRRQNENVLMSVRYHLWILMPIFYTWLAIVLVVGLIMWHWGASQITSYAIFIGAVIGLIYSSYTWFLWNGSNYIITNQRVIRIEQLGIFNSEISEAEIDRIQEISTDIKGPIRTLFNFGTIHIKTASEDSKVDMVDVVNPYDIQQEIARVRQRMADSHELPRPGGLD